MTTEHSDRVRCVGFEARERGAFDLANFLFQVADSVDSGVDHLVCVAPVHSATEWYGWYRCEFNGKTVGSLGISRELVVDVYATDAEQARLRLYEVAEHIHGCHVYRIPAGTLGSVAPRDNR